MVSTHMAAGFVTSGIGFRLIIELFPSDVRPRLFLLFPYVLAAGLFGGLFPDFDRIEGKLDGITITHRKTLHFPFGYALLATASVIALLVFSEEAWLLSPCFAFLLSAGLHSLMDIYDGLPKKKPGAVYEHLTGRWIKGTMLIPFGSTREWVVYSALAIGFLSFSTYPYPIPVLGADAINFSLLLYILTWAPAAAYELLYVVPERRKGKT